MTDICMIDIKFKHYWDGIKEFSFGSGYTLLGHEIAIWNPNGLFSQYLEDFDPQLNGQPILDPSVSAMLCQSIERRKSEMLTFLEDGRNIFIIAPLPEKCFIPASNSTFKELNIVDAMPIGVEFEHAEGYNLEFRGDELFRTFFETNQEHMKYYANIQLPEGKPFLYIKNTNLVVGAYTEYLNGNVVFIPSVLEFYDYGHEYENKVFEEEFIKSILQLDRELKHNLKDEDLPQWSQEFLLPKEIEEKQRLQEIKEQISLLMSQSVEQAELIRELETYKLLFTGTGKPLEQIVKKVLIEIGFEVTEGLPGRDDLILKYQDKVAVVEVKGVTKSAAEKHAAQLEKWVSGYIEKFGVNPKGMLIVNSFCNLPLYERVEDTFPNQMLSYSERRDHALINTLQLLGGYLDVQKNPDIKDRIIEDLFSTNGKYESYTNFLEFLDHTPHES
ncbi:hypothetical protein ACFWMP_25355 [Paenibacillus sp. NPDC058367]|uniref:hypothetical protein n=1 Tax=Paenibacillus sp. NPDC058367 TaxID=3346460 RepID=UPI003656EF45